MLINHFTYKYLIIKHIHVYIIRFKYVIRCIASNVYEAIQV
jgi:hypothetical protein